MTRPGLRDLVDVAVAVAAGVPLSYLVVLAPLPVLAVLFLAAVVAVAVADLLAHDERTEGPRLRRVVELEEEADLVVFPPGALTIELDDRPAARRGPWAPRSVPGQPTREDQP